MSRQLLSADACPVCTKVHGETGDWPACPAHRHLLYQLKVNGDGWTYACPASRCRYTHTQQERATMSSHAIERREAGGIADAVRASRGWFTTIVPSHVDAGAFVALTIGYLRRDPKLARAAADNQPAFMAALSECARLGLVPGDTYHLVPFAGDIVGIVDYTGEIELMYRAGAVASVKAENVHAKDHFRYTTDMDRPEHAPDWFGDRGDLIGAYAYAVMKDGATSKVIVYSKADIDKVRAVSKAANAPGSPWVQWYDRQTLKTVLHRLAKFVPTSAEYRREQLRAAAEIAQQVNGAPLAAVMPAPSRADEDPVHDAEIVDEPPAPSSPIVAAPSRRQRKQDAPDDTHTLREQVDAEFGRLGLEDEEERAVYEYQLAGVPHGAELSPDDLRRVLAALADCETIAHIREITGDEGP